MDTAEEACPYEEKTTGIRVRVVLFDPLAHAGLYEQWGESSDGKELEAEIVPTELDCVVKGEDGRQVADWTFQPETSDGEDREHVVKQGESLPAIASQYGVAVESLRIFRGGQEVTDSVLSNPTGPPWHHIGDIVRITRSQGGPELQVDEGVSDGEECTIELSALSTSGDGKAFLTCHTEDGEVLDTDPEEPIARKHFRVRAPGEYLIRIWLRPHSIVLHWTGGNRIVNNPAAHQWARTHYHFLVDGDGKWFPGGLGNEHAKTWKEQLSRWSVQKWEPWQQSPRLWWNNLRIDGISKLRRDEYVTLDLSQSIGSSARPEFFWQGRPRQAYGYAAHTYGFHHTLGVSFCGMGVMNVKKNDPRQNKVTVWEGKTYYQWQAVNKPAMDGNDWGPYPLKEDQVLGGLKRVAEMCQAFRFDPADERVLCTHYEVELVHGKAQNDKWDITKLQFRADLNKGKKLVANGTKTSAGTSDCDVGKWLRAKCKEYYDALSE